MIMRLLFLMSVCTINYTQVNEAFFQLRNRHLSETVAQHFVADLDSKSANLLINKKIKKPYRVEFVYDANRGIQLLVKDTEPFYEQLLSSYSTYVNTMMFPLLNTSSFSRLQKRFHITNDENTYQLSFKKGDMNVKYIFDEGKLGLIDKIQYFENDKRIYILQLDWKMIQQKYVPISVKSVSYLKTRQVASFRIENIQLK